MYMIGEVAALRDRVISVAELHEQVCQGGVETLRGLASRASAPNEHLTSNERKDRGTVGDYRDELHVPEFAKFACLLAEYRESIRCRSRSADRPLASRRLFLIGPVSTR